MRKIFHDNHLNSVLSIELLTLDHADENCVVVSANEAGFTSPRRLREVARAFSEIADVLETLANEKP